MNSSDYPTYDVVLKDLGDRFIHTFIDAVEGARADYAEFKDWRPGWFPSFTDRFTANFLHERIWDRLVRDTAEMEDIHVSDQEPVRELRSGSTYLIRVKRHRTGDRIAAYPTKSARQFWTNELTLEGLESVNLALGYYWDDELREVGDPVVSFRDGKDKPIWACRLHRESSTATDFTWEPISSPALPDIDLSSIAPETEEETPGS